MTNATVVVRGRKLTPTVVFDAYWRFAAARHEIYQARLAGRPGPWTDDAILQHYRFTNCYRAADRVSQYLIGTVMYRGSQTWSDVFFRTLLFKLFNRVSTWQLLCRHVGDPRWVTYERARYDGALEAARQQGRRLYTAAYVMPSPPLGAV